MSSKQIYPKKKNLKENYDTEQKKKKTSSHAQNTCDKG